MLQGSCLCGKVRYELRGKLRVAYYCHCGKCRKQSGSSFATNVIVARDDFVIVAGQELISSWESSPNKRRYFCSGCGSPIYSHGEKTGHIVSVRCGTLDSELSLHPSVHAFVASKAGWFEIRDGLAQHPEYFA
jgi:hypothetical protein